MKKTFNNFCLITFLLYFRVCIHILIVFFFYVVDIIKCEIWYKNKLSIAFLLFQIKFDNKVVKKKRIWSLNELITVDGKTSSQVIQIYLLLYFM